MVAAVSLIRVDKSMSEFQDAVKKAVKEAMERAGWKKYVKKGEDTLLKVNMCWCDFLLPGMCTSPWVLESVIDVIYDYVGRIYVVEGKASAQQSFEVGVLNNRYDRVAEKYGVKLLDLSKLDFETLKVEGVPFPIKLSKICKKISNYIPVGPMKTHSVTGFTGALKNQFGVTDEKRVLYHFHLDKIIPLVNRLISPVFAVLDGTVILQGNGPANGIPTEMDLVLASKDLVAVDSVACKIMGIDPEKIEHIVESQRIGLGNMEAEVRGEKIGDVAKDLIKAQPQLYAAIMFGMMARPALKEVFFNHLWRLGTLGVKIIRDSWYFFKGKKLTKNFLKNSPYSRQWKPLP